MRIGCGPHNFHPGSRSSNSSRNQYLEVTRLPHALRPHAVESRAELSCFGRKSATLESKGHHLRWAAEIQTPVQGCQWPQRQGTLALQWRELVIEEPFKMH